MAALGEGAIKLGKAITSLVMIHDQRFEKDQPK